MLINLTTGLREVKFDSTSKIMHTLKPIKFLTYLPIIILLYVMQNNTCLSSPRFHTDEAKQSQWMHGGKSCAMK